MHPRTARLAALGIVASASGCVLIPRPAPCPASAAAHCQDLPNHQRILRCASGADCPSGYQCATSVVDSRDGPPLRDVCIEPEAPPTDWENPQQRSRVVDVLPAWPCGVDPSRWEVRSHDDRQPGGSFCGWRMFPPDEHQSCRRETSDFYAPGGEYRGPHYRKDRLALGAHREICGQQVACACDGAEDEADAGASPPAATPR